MVNDPFEHALILLTSLTNRYAAAHSRKGICVAGLLLVVILWSSLGIAGEEADMRARSQLETVHMASFCLPVSAICGTISFEAACEVF